MEVARGKRDKAFKDVCDMVKGSPDHQLAQLLNNCQRLQPRKAGLAKEHLKRAEGPCFRELEADLQAAHERVRVAEDVVKAFHPSLDFTNMSMELLQGLLVEACEGVYPGCMGHDFIPSLRWYIEALHLIINTGNSWIEVFRDTFQYLLTPEGKVRSGVRRY
jgi:hypothetical protein